MTFTRLGILLSHSVLLACVLMPVAAFAADTTQSANTPVPATSAAQTNAQAPGNATGQFVPLTHFPQIQSLAQSQGFTDFANTLYKICIGAGAVLAVLMIMYAGVEFMRSSGSVTTNEKAKNRIQNAILGLILVLAPTIVFGIINPEILHLNLGTEFTQLQQKGIQQGAFVSSTTGSTSLPSSCSDYTDMQSKNQLDTCTAPAVKVDATCCQVNDASVVCCARPKTSASTAVTQYEWKVTVKSSTGGGLKSIYGLGSPPPSSGERSGGPFNSQQECQTSWAAFTASGVQYNSPPTCSCDKPRSEYPSCSQ